MKTLKTAQGQECPFRYWNQGHPHHRSAWYWAHSVPLWKQNLSTKFLHCSYLNCSRRNYILNRVFFRLVSIIQNIVKFTARHLFPWRFQIQDFLFYMYHTCLNFFNTSALHYTKISTLCNHLNCLTWQRLQPLEDAKVNEAVPLQKRVYS